MTLTPTTRAFETGPGGQDYHAVLGWDAKDRIFRGPSQLITRQATSGYRRSLQRPPSG